ncbi:MAG: cysteine--tRNA ligase [Candidatus Omnitrophota bacterium]
MVLRFWNTLTREKEIFTPLDTGRVTLYTCGPTVYDFAHIGNFRAYVFEDVLRRYLEYRGYAITHVMNITDIDDKTIKCSREEGLSLAEYTRIYEKAFFEDRDTLRIKPADIYPRATEHIPEMVALVKRLAEQGYTYEKDGSIYFSIARFPSYGRLARLDLSSLKEGVRIDSDEYEKEDIKDFVLWKRSKPGEPCYETPIGPGRPGWHIECSAMSMKYLGETLDLHTGGVDNIFPHHENEIAQSESATGKTFVRYFLHCAHLLSDNEKMSKSKGNFYTIRDLLAKGYDPVAIRYLLLSVHYRSPLNFTLKALEASRNAIERIQGFYNRVIVDSSQGKENPAVKGEIDKAIEQFEAGLDDDLNTPEALAAVHNLITNLNPLLEKGSLVTADILEITTTLKKFDTVLAILTDEKMELTEEEKNLVAERESARKTKDFQKADTIRKVLKDRGITVEDTPSGSRIIKVE